MRTIDCHFIGEKSFRQRILTVEVFYSAIASELKRQFQNRSENRGERTFIMLECIIHCDACVVNMFTKL